MNRRPNLIAPVLIVACALIVMGGIATGLSQTDDPAISTAFPIVLQENETPIPTMEVTTGMTVDQTLNTTAPITIEPTGTGVDEPETIPVDNTTEPTPIPTAGGADWTLPNGDAANTRSVAPDETVTGLSQEWSTAIAAGSRANPIVVGDRVFVQDSSGTTYAFDRTTGEELWSREDYEARNQTTEPTVSLNVTGTGVPTGNVTIEPTGPVDNRTLADIALADPDLSTMVTALQQTGLDLPLNESGPFTVFAPNNAAFEALPAGALDDLLANPAALADVLPYHVVSGLYPADVLGTTSSLVTVQGRTLNVTSTADGRVMVNDAMVVQADLQATNGVLHVIDTVLLPSNESVSPTQGPAASETATPASEPTVNETTTVNTTDMVALQRVRALPVLGQEPNETTEPTTIATIDGGANETPTVNATETATAEPTVQVNETPTLEPTGNVTVSPTETQSGAAEFEGRHGPVSGDGSVFVPVAPASLVSLDPGTGEVQWTTELTTDPNMVIAMQPSYADGLVYVSTSPGPDLDAPEGGGIGTIYAVDAASGQVLWEFLTVDSPDIWGNPDVNSGGGAQYSPAFDGGTMFWSTAGPNPAPGTPEYPNAESRPGPNLWTNGVGAIDAVTGAPGWFTQAIPADIYDHDFFVPPVLATATVQGQERSLVIGAGEDGHVIAFDRETGGILWSSTLGRHENDRLERFPNGGLTAWPGALGGVHAPMAVADGYVYVASNELPTTYRPTGITANPDLAQARGMISAVNLSTGRIGWQRSINSATTGGATVVGDVVMTGTHDGRVLLLDRDTGTTRAERFLAGPITSTPAVAGGIAFWQAGTGGGARVVALTLEGAGAPVEPTGTVMPNETVIVNETPLVEPTLTISPTGTGGAENLTLVDLAVSQPDLTTLVTAVSEADLVGALSGTEEYTVFAPDDAAFDALPEGTLAALLADPAALGDLLTYHVVPGVYTADALENTTTLVTVQGQTLNVTRAPGGGVMVNDATVLQADLEASNGVLHVIDAVLVPSNGSARPTEAPTANETTTETTTAAVTTAPTGTETTVVEENPPPDGYIAGTFAPAVPGEGKSPMTARLA